MSILTFYIVKGHLLSPPKRPKTRKIVRYRRKQDVEKGDLGKFKHASLKIVYRAIFDVL